MRMALNTRPYRKTGHHTVSDTMHRDRIRQVARRVGAVRQKMDDSPTKQKFAWRRAKGSCNHG